MHEVVMNHQALRFVSLLFGALGLAPGAAHVLEMPVKLAYTPQLYFAVTSTLYALFGSVGAVIQVGALVIAGWLAFVSRGLPGVRFVVAAVLLLGLSLVAWGALVAPVNAQWGKAIASGSNALPQLYAALRLRWEYGHVAAFALWFAGFCCLQWFAVSSRSLSARGKSVA
jgi:hypothetical protein